MEKAQPLEHVACPIEPMAQSFADLTEPMQPDRKRSPERRLLVRPALGRWPVLCPKVLETTLICSVRYMYVRYQRWSPEDVVPSTSEQSYEYNCNGSVASVLQSLVRDQWEVLDLFFIPCSDEAWFEAQLSQRSPFGCAFAFRLWRFREWPTHSTG